MLYVMLVTIMCAVATYDMAKHWKTNDISEITIIFVQTATSVRRKLWKVVIYLTTGLLSIIDSLYACFVACIDDELP